MWYSIVSCSGDEFEVECVKYDMNVVASKMTPEQILKARQLKREYIKKFRYGKRL